MLKLLSSLLIAFIGFSCGMRKQQPMTNAVDGQTIKDGIIYKVDPIQNKMPMSASIPYVVIVISPEKDVFTENIQVTKIELKDEKNSWNSTVFDDGTPKGKGEKRVDFVARNLDPKLTGKMTARLSITFESGKKDVIIIENIQLQTVF